MKLRIGTRRSRLALAQAGEVADALLAKGHETELVPIVTSGDRGAPQSASPAGMKGLFVAEIVRALQDGEIDLAVHSAKDLPAEDDEGIAIGAVPERASPFDVLVTRDGELPDGGSVGTSSLRRKAFMLKHRPRVRVVEIRGNVDTRLRKLDDGEVDGLVLAAAGLERLGIDRPHSEQIAMIPAPGQGALAVQARAGDPSAQQAVGALDHPDTRTAVEAERSLMARMGGGCALPLGAYGYVDSQGLAFFAIVVSPDGERDAKAEVRAATAAEAVQEAEHRLREAGAEKILAEVRE